MWHRSIGTTSLLASCPPMGALLWGTCTVSRWIFFIRWCLRSAASTDFLCTRLAAVFVWSLSGRPAAATSIGFVRFASTTRSGVRAHWLTGCWFALICCCRHSQPAAGRGWPSPPSGRTSRHADTPRISAASFGRCPPRSTAGGCSGIPPAPEQLLYPSTPAAGTALNSCWCRQSPTSLYLPTVPSVPAPGCWFCILCINALPLRWSAVELLLRGVVCRGAGTCWVGVVGGWALPGGWDAGPLTTYQLAQHPLPTRLPQPLSDFSSFWL